MSRKKPPVKKPSRKLGAGAHVPTGYALDRLYGMFDSIKGTDPAKSAAARLFSRGRQQIAKKLGEEAVEALIEGIRGDKPKLVGESADLLYHLLALWAAVGVEPAEVWAELDRREGLSGVAGTATRPER